MQIPEIVINSLNLQSEEEIREFLLTALQWAEFAERYFKNPDDLDKPLRLEPGQRKAINALQFGYDIDYVPSNYIIKNPPKIVVMIWSRQTGKTTGVVTGAATILVLQPGVKIGVMAQSETMAKEFIQRTADILRNSPFKSHIEKITKMEVRMKHGGYMRAHTTSESIRGQSYHYLILDEAARIEDEIIEGAALDTARKIGKRVIMLSTPAGYGGSLVKYYQQGLRTRPIICKNCFTNFTQAHFKTTQFDPIIMARGLPPCPECGFELEDGQSEKEDIMTDEKIIEGKTYFYGVGHYTVISIDPFSSSFYSKDEILEELRRRGNTATARQELLGEIIAEGQGVFRKEWLDAAEDPVLQNIFMKKKNINYIMGVDYGKVHDNSVAVIGHEDPKSRQIIVDYLRIIRSGNIEYEDIKNDLIEIVSYFKPIWILADATGIGEPVIEFMEKDLIRIGWQGRIYSNKTNHLGFYIDPKTKPDLIENLVTYFARKRIRMPTKYDGDMGVLYNELLNFSYDITKTNYLKYGVQSEHDDTVIAVALMVWGHKHKPWIPLDAAFDLPRGELL